MSEISNSPKGKMDKYLGMYREDDNTFTEEYKNNGAIGTGNITLPTVKNVADAQELTGNLNNNAKIYSKLALLDELKNYYFDKINQTSFRVVCHDGINAIEYLLKKDTNDDFFKLNNVRLCLLNEVNRNFYNSSPTDRVGTFVGTTGNLYTTTVGDKYTATVTGECIKLYCFTDNRGGIWEVVVDDDYNNKIYVSTYSATSGQKELVVGRTFKNGKHKIEATFRGDDPSNPPSGGAGTARGWMYYTDTPTIYGTVLGFNYNSDNIQLELLGAESNKEIAFQAKIGAETNFFPDHGVGTAIRTDFKMYLNKLSVDFFIMPNGTHIQIAEFKLVQKMKYNQPIAGDIADVIFSHEFCNGEFIFKSNVKFLQNATLLNYYPLMIPLNTTGDKMYLSSNRDITTTGNNAITTFSPESISLPDVCTIHSANSNVTVLGSCYAKLNTYDTNKTSLFLWDRAIYPKLYYNLVLLNTPINTGDTISGISKLKAVYSENVKGVILQF